MIELNKMQPKRLLNLSALDHFVEKSGIPLLFFASLLLLWWQLPIILQNVDGTTGSVDQSIWLLVVLSLISFLLLTGLCWWLLQYSWTNLGLPALHLMVSQFKTLALWQQLGFYWASFALLLLAAISCLAAVC